LQTASRTIAKNVSGELTTAEQTACETYRVVVLGQSGTEVLVVPDGDRFALPSVNIPRWQRVAENLTAAVETDWGEEVVCLFEPDAAASTDAPGIHYQAAEHWRVSGKPKMPTQWVPFSALAHDSLIGASDYPAIQQSIARCSAEGNESPSGPFARLGWFRELREWVQAVIAPLGFHLEGNFRQLNASPTFSLVRFETEGPALWFKAVGEPNQREFPITSTLAQLFPNYLPGILAIRADCNGWLTREVAGKLLRDVQEAALWETAAAALAELQIESADHGARVLAAGARDLGATALSKLVRPFIEIMAQLMERQPNVPPPVLSRKDLLLLGDRIQSALEALEALEALGISGTLGHLDLNPGNIIVAPRRCAFLDWAEAYVGSPFFTFQYLLEHRRRTLGADSAVETRLITSYCAQWEQVVSRAAIAEALALAPLLAALAYAVGSDAWKDTQSLEDPATAGYLRSLTGRMNREANELADRRSLCLH
jgi:phosphotransferase family enzyme